MNNYQTARQHYSFEVSVRGDIDHGFDGYTAIHIKYHPLVISHYQQYGAEIIRPDRMALSTIASTRLIQLYLERGER